VRGGFETQRAALVQKRTELEGVLERLNKRGPELEQQGSALETEEQALDGIHRRLLVTQPQTAALRDELLRIRERVLAIEKEKTEVKRGQARLVEDLGRARPEKTQLAESIAELERQLRAHKEQFDSSDAEYGSKLRELEKARARANSDFNRLERAKIDPYREIGRVLADSGVAPLNQPHALADVYGIRQKIAETEAAVTNSLQVSSGQDEMLLRVSLGLWGVVAVAVVLIACALL
jgi:chromosome segregation ATPase